MYLDWLGSQEYATVFAYLVPEVWKFLKEDFLHCTLVIAHQLGYNLGMSHVKEFGFCRKKECIVSAHNTNTSAFSNCSYGSYLNLMNHSGVYLTDIPASWNVIPLE